jgi:tripartite-type tricarboxylate transporter receptor subunit TctC
MLKRVANVNMVFVPYPGTAPAVNTLLGGHVTSAFANHGEVVGQLNAGKLRALATASRTRIEPLPDVPTITELGYQDLEDLETWNGLEAPAKTPKETLALLAGWFTAALRAPEMKSKLIVQGLYPVGICGDEYAAHLRKKFEEYGRVIRESNIKTE